VTTQTATQQIIGLIPVVFGALIALAGGGIKYWIDQIDKRKARRREKLERLLHLAYGVREWTGSLDGRYAFGTDSDELPSPIEEARVICTIYFPELSDEIKHVAVTALRYSGVVRTLGAERLRGGGTPSVDAKDRIEAAYAPLSDAVHKLIQKAAPIAKDVS